VWEGESRRLGGALVNPTSESRVGTEWLESGELVRLGALICTGMADNMDLMSVVRPGRDSNPAFHDSSRSAIMSTSGYRSLCFNL
jgi:hypothetical protein